MRSSREAGLKAMHTMTQNYATLVSGVLIGLLEALEQGKKTKLGHLRSRLEKRGEKAENKLHQVGIRLCRFRYTGPRHHLSEVAVTSPRHPHLLNAQMVTMSAW